MLYKIPKAHKYRKARVGLRVYVFAYNFSLYNRYAINKICKLDTHLIATGDDEGIVKVKETKQRKCFSFN
jgi:hypothetical protein